MQGGSADVGKQGAAISMFKVASPEAGDFAVVATLGQAAFALGSQVCTAAHRRQGRTTCSVVWWFC